jgi:hypothetical protein
MEITAIHNIHSLFQMTQTNKILLICTLFNNAVGNYLEMYSFDL